MERDRANQIEKRLQTHSELPFWRRVIKRLRGDYPNGQERYELKEHKELGLYGRIAHAVGKTMYVTDVINAHANALRREHLFSRGIGKANWTVEDGAGKEMKASAPMMIDERSKQYKLVESLLQQKRGHGFLDEADIRPDFYEVGTFVTRDEYDLADMPKGDIGFYVKGGGYAEAVMVYDKDIEGMSEEQRYDLENLAVQIEENARGLARNIDDYADIAEIEALVPHR